MRAAVRRSKDATLRIDGCHVFLDGTGEVLYNDHTMGTPPSVVGPASVEPRREVSSSLSRPAAIIPVNAPAVKPVACAVSQCTVAADQSV